MTSVAQMHPHVAKTEVKETPMPQTKVETPQPQNINKTKAARIITESEIKENTAKSLTVSEPFVESSLHSDADDLDREDQEDPSLPQGFSSVMPSSGQDSKPNLAQKDKSPPRGRPSASQLKQGVRDSVDSLPKPAAQGSKMLKIQDN